MKSVWRSIANQVSTGLSPHRSSASISSSLKVGLVHTCNICLLQMDGRIAAKARATSAKQERKR